MVIVHSYVSHYQRVAQQLLPQRGFTVSARSGALGRQLGPPGSCRSCRKICGDHGHMV